MKWSQGVTVAEFWRHASAVFERLLSNLGDKAERWEQLIQHIENLLPDERGRFLETLRTVDLTKLGTDARRRIAGRLREKVCRHRGFPQARWAFPTEIVDELDSIGTRIEPEDVIERSVWLFARTVQLPASAGLPSQQQHEAVLGAQLESIKSILAMGGLPKVAELSNAVESPEKVGFVLGKWELIEESALLPADLSSANEKTRVLASGYADGRFAASGWEWVDRLPLTEWTPAQAASLLLHLPFGPRTWDLAGRLGEGVSGFYWGRVTDLGHGLTTEEVERAVSTLIGRSRAFQAIAVIDTALYSERAPSPSLIMEALEAGLKPRPEATAENTSNIS
jgi:hypothetical protein